MKCRADRVWSYAEGKLLTHLAAQREDHPVLEAPRYTAKDVTIIIPTVDTPASFPQTVSDMLKNGPLEIVIVTTDRNHDHVKELLSKITHDDDYFTEDIPIQPLTVPSPGLRKQFARGIRLARGSIIAKADDDVVWGPRLLKFLVAPFEDPAVGCSSGAQAAYIPPERQDPNVITPWEVAALYAMSKRGNKLLKQHIVDGGIMCADGHTVLYRTAMIKNEALLRTYLNDSFAGKPIDSGDDFWLTRHMDLHGWKHGFQTAREAMIGTDIETTSKYVSQLTRWERSTLRGCLQNLWKTAMLM
jgi:cellulose synthase/poly-beta-1,6-N-acetylglucosamine synthase-like glycosyltransferase